jgi:hypothetical protein
MSNEMIESLAKRTERKRFLARAGAASLGLVAAAFARPATAEALVDTHGCTLCDSPTSCSGKICYWCWWGTCFQGKHYQCCEGYTSVSSCTGGCTSGQVCSRLGGTKAC